MHIDGSAINQKNIKFQNLKKIGNKKSRYKKKNVYRFFQSISLSLRYQLFRINKK